MPRSFFSADQHDHVRDGSAEGFRLTSIWDLFDVKPLFRIPSGVLFAEKAKNGEGIRKWKGKVFSGDLKFFNSRLSDVEDKLKETDKDWFFTQMGSSSAFSVSQSTVRTDASAYKEHFDQGATIVPRAFYFVDLNQDLPDDFDDRILQIRTAVELVSGNESWKDVNLRGSIESRFLFRTALSKSIFPFALFRPNLVALPMTVEESDRGGKIIKLHTAEELSEKGFRHASKWFANAESLWEKKRTEKNKKYSLIEYLNWQQKVSNQNLNAPYLVLYNSSAKNANATVLIREELDLEFIADHKEYIFTTDRLEEAYYLTAILNADAITNQLRDFQTRGLFGFRDIHKKILDVFFPRFNSTDERHLQIAEMSRDCHTKASQYIKDNPPTRGLTPRFLGQLRSEIKKHLVDELKAIDDIVLDIII